MNEDWEARRYVLVVAGTAGTPVFRRLRELLRAPPLVGRARVEAVSSVADAARRLRLAAGEIAVAVGGDGTANLLARALRLGAERPVLGLLPLGTGNALAHALGVGTPARALQALGSGSPRALDVMVTTHPVAGLALASLSAGFEGRFLARYARWRRYGRVLAAAAALPPELGWGRGRAPIRVAVDGTALGDDVAYNAGFYNIPCYAGGRKVWAVGEAWDGEGDVVLCPTRAAYWRALLRGPGESAGERAGGPRVHRWRRAAMESPGPIQFDGESAPGGSFELRLEPGALSVLVPEGVTAP